MVHSKDENNNNVNEEIRDRQKTSINNRRKYETGFWNLLQLKLDNMSRREKILYIIVIILLCGFAYLIWCNITFAESKEIMSKKSYIENMKVQEQQIKALWEEENAKCEENLDYYHSQAIYLRATIEQEEANLTEMLGLTKQR